MWNLRYCFHVTGSKMSTNGIHTTQCFEFFFDNVVVLIGAWKNRCKRIPTLPTDATTDDAAAVQPSIRFSFCQLTLFVGYNWATTATAAATAASTAASTAVMGCGGTCLQGFGHVYKWVGVVLKNGLK